MKLTLKFIYAVSILLLVNSVNAQQVKRKKQTLDDIYAKIEENSKCLKRNIYSANKRRLLFPFKNAQGVSIISFIDTNSIISSRIPIKNMILDRGLVLEEKVLNQKEIDQLTDIIFNYGFKAKDKERIITRTKCYDPHNGILFYNENKSVKYYIEICFDCQNFKSNIKKINLGDNCTEKFNLLRKFFVGNGITKLSSEDIYNR